MVNALSRLLFVTCLAAAAVAQSPLGSPPAPAANPTTAAKSVLGKVLFWDEQLASNGRMACGTCHLPEFGGGDARRRRHPGNDGILNNADDTWGSPGVERRDAMGRYVVDARFGTGEQVTSRAALSVAMAAWFPEQFWDGRGGDELRDPETNVLLIANGASLEAQSLHPLRSEVEMAREGRSWAEIRTRLAGIAPLALATDLPADVQQALAAAPSYPALFAAAFGDPAITLGRVAMALASYQRSVVPNQTPWDLHAAGVPNALTPDQLAGLQIYQGEAGCASCHTTGLFTDLQFRALGVVPVSQDPGRGAVTGQSADLGAFKVPSLRNAALKSTFLHNGRFTTMAQVVNFYRNGAGTFTPKDSLIQTFDIDPVETQQLLDFLEQGLVDPRARNRTAPFDRPTLFSEQQPLAANLFGTATAVAGRTPELQAQMPLFLGNPEWSVGFANGPANGPGWFVLGLLPAAPGAQLAGVALNVVPDAFALVLPLVLDGAGRNTLVLPMPFAPQLRGIPLFGQGLVGTPVGAPLFGGTRGASFVIR
jgi:cytochrome c peroxidase